jgi:hypothetical protein
MDLPESQVTNNTPRALGVHTIDTLEFQVTYESPT